MGTNPDQEQLMNKIENEQLKQMEQMQAAEKRLQCKSSHSACADPTAVIRRLRAEAGPGGPRERTILHA